MPRRSLFALFALAAAIALCADSALASSIDWAVIHPFRFYKNQDDFARHLNAYAAVKDAAGGTRPDDAIQQVERKLNAPACTNPATPESCYATRGNAAEYEKHRLGWAAQSYRRSDVCYGDPDPSDRHPRYEAHCRRAYSWGTVEEDYVIPRFHAVTVALTKEDRGRLRGLSCHWRWAARTAQSNSAGDEIHDCSAEFAIHQVPYPDGVHVTVEMPGEARAEMDVVVDDVLVVGLGDSFASGEGNPDKPIRPHPIWSVIYGDDLPARDVATAGMLTNRRTALVTPKSSLPGSRPGPRPTRDTGGLARPDAGTLAGNQTFYAAAAQWISPDCHRSQYSYQFRVALQLAVESRHRAVTLIHLACSGADTKIGLFGEMSAREHLSTSNRVPGQFDQLLSLLCAERATTATSFGPDVLPVIGCKDGRLKRKIDLVMLSMGGNDIGFSPIVGYTFIERASAFGAAAALYEQLSGQHLIFGPDIGRQRLATLDKRFAAIKSAFQRLLRVEPDRVVQTGYDPIPYDISGRLCSGNSGLDVHPRFKFIDARLRETARFSDDFFAYLACVADKQTASNCPPQPLATGNGTKFHFVTSFQAQFIGRGICAFNVLERPFAKIPTINIGSTKPGLPPGIIHMARARAYFRRPTMPL